MKKGINSIYIYISYFWRNAKIYTICFFVKYIVFAIISAINSIYILKMAFDTFANRDKLPELIQYIMVFFLINTIIYISNMWFEHVYRPKVELKIRKLVQKEMFDKAKQIDLSYYDDPEFYDKYILSLNEMDERVIQTLEHIGNIVSNVVGIITILSVIVTIDLLSVLLVIISVGISFIFNAKHSVLFVEKNIQNVKNNRKREYIQRIHYLKDYLLELKMIKNKDFIYDEYNEASQNAMRINNKYGKKMMIISIAKGFSESILSSYSIYFVLFYKLIITKTITIGGFSAVINSIWSFTEKLNRIVEDMRNLTEDTVYFDKLNEFRGIKTIDKKRSTDKISDCPEVLKVSNVSFAYDDKKEVLKDITLEINPREKIAIVGENGAGKTTLINIMLGLYEGYQGTITIADKNIKILDRKALYEYFGVLFQDYNTYATTIANNVKMDEALEKDSNNIINSLKKVGFNDKYMLSKKGISKIISKEYDANGCELSGGEGHKVAMARSVATNSKIVFLDEPSSMLDPVAESDFNRLLMTEFNDRTVIFVSHRFIATKLVDRIFMISDSKIIESGSHNELMKLNGHYAKLYKLQSKKYNVSER